MRDVDLALLLIRLAVGVTFAAHGAQKALGVWGGPGLAGWRAYLATLGFRPSRVVAPLSAWVMLACGLLLVVGLATPVASAALASVAVAVISIDRANGFFEVRGGVEYAIVLGMAVASISVAGPGSLSVDAAVGISAEPTTRIAALILGIACGLFAVLLRGRVGADPGAGDPPCVTASHG